MDRRSFMARQYAYKNVRQWQNSEVCLAMVLNQITEDQFIDVLAGLEARGFDVQLQEQGEGMYAHVDTRGKAPGVIRLWWGVDLDGCIHPPVVGDIHHMNALCRLVF